MHDKRENWRSLANPLKFVNRIFAYKNLGGREYEPLSLARNSSLNGKVELIVIETDFSWNAEYHRKIIGKAISNRIYYGLFGTDPYKRFNVEKNGNSARAKPGDVAVLVRDRKFLPWITYFLKRNNVPFIVFKGSGFLETEEIRDALAVISFLENPADDLSLIAILRSPIFGFSDDLILKISVLSGKTFYEKMKNAFRAEKLFTNTEFEMIRRFIEIVEPLFPLYQAEKPSNAIMKFLEKSWAWMLYAALPDGAQRIENLKKFILYLLEYEKRSFSGDVIEWMVSLKENESEAPVELEGDDAVKILTIHAAKGLEFPVVVLPLWKFERKGGKSSDLIIDRANIALKYFDPLKGEIEDEEFKIMREKEKERLKEEEERLLYVALTRAKDHLSLIFDENFVSENKPEKLPELYKNMKSLLKNDSEVNIDCYQIPIDELEKKEIIAYEASIEKFISIGNFDDFMLTKAKPMVKAAESYIEISATELAEAIYKKDEFKETDERVREYASDFGSLVHDIIIFEPERIDNFIEDFVKRFEFCKPEDIRTQINNIIEKFRNSELYNFMRGKQNLTILREFPFSLRRKNLIINGRIDLLVLSGKEAYIIDIKSDRIEDN
ncbi:MAG: 3'-5' exonuclease, partial [bacterium]